MKRTEKYYQMGFRVTEEQRQRLDRIAAASGMSMSEVFRALVEAAESVDKLEVRQQVIVNPTVPAEA
jgi:uncharacterized protein (DUF1778 family)